MLLDLQFVLLLLFLETLTYLVHVLLVRFFLRLQQLVLGEDLTFEFFVLCGD